jgi:hypothetical protein
MSWEQVLFLVVFLVLPLLQSLGKRQERARREREENQSSPRPLADESAAVEEPLPWETKGPLDWLYDKAPKPEPVYVPQPVIHRSPTASSVTVPPYGSPNQPTPLERQPNRGRPIEPRRPRPLTAKPPGLSPKRIRAVLRNPRGFREAVVYKVVLDAPLSLRPPK